MTTIILACKLLLVKSYESQFAKFQRLKNSIMKEKIQVNRYGNNGRALKKLCMERKQSEICRLCLKVAERKIFGLETDINIAESIKNILNIEINKDDGKPQHICKDCEEIICKTNELKQVAELTQWRLEQEHQILSENTCDDNVEDFCNSVTDSVTEKEENVKTRSFKTQKKCNIQENSGHGKLRQKVNQGAYICETCGLKLKTLCRLKTHRLIHTNDFRYSCAHCPYRARTTYSLQIHERIHTGDKPYRCIQCPSSFASASNLASHRRSHLPPAFICDTCHKGFKFKEPLLNHIASQHRSAKPFCCTTCVKAFATRKLLRRHERSMHNRPKMRIGATPSYIRTQKEIIDEHI